MTGGDWAGVGMTVAGYAALGFVVGLIMLIQSQYKKDAAQAKWSAKVVITSLIIFVVGFGVCAQNFTIV